MKRLALWAMVLAVALWLSAPAGLLAQGKGKGKPATTGLEHAETRANPQGQKGIENAEAKQARNESKETDKGKTKTKKGKAKAKGHGKGK